MSNEVKIRYGITTSKSSNKHVWVDFGCCRWHSGNITDGNAERLLVGLRQKNLTIVNTVDARTIDRLVVGLALAGW